MWARRVKELVAMSAIGDGVLALIAPSSHASLWIFGPQSMRKLNRWFAENPTYTRLVGLAEIGFAVWLALRQYREAARPWYQRGFSQYRSVVAAPWLASLGLLAILLATLAVIYKRSSKGERVPVEDQARQEMRRLIRESVERSRRH